MIIILIWLPATIIPGWNYIIGSIIGLFILGYLVYTLVRPDKF